MQKAKLVAMRISYIVEITGWDWAYWLSINEGDVTTGPMTEMRHLLITGILRSPAVPKAKVVQITLLPRADMGHFHVPKGTLERMGGIYLDGDVLKVIQSIPQDALPPILTMLIADRFKSAVITGSSSLTYEEGSVYGFALSQKSHDKNPC